MAHAFFTHKEKEEDNYNYCKNTQGAVFWVVTLCSDVIGYQHFRGSSWR